LRELRADAYLGQGNVVHAISDIRSVTRLTSGRKQGFTYVSLINKTSLEIGYDHLFP
jgi:hypothetical protein